MWVIHLRTDHVQHRHAYLRRSIPVFGPCEGQPTLLTIQLARKLPLEHNETALRSLSSLKLCPLANGMVAISGQLDPESGAVLSAALDPLTAPNPCEANGGRDPRQADRRRADALIELARRATAAGSNAPTTTKAQIVVTIDYDRLVSAVKGAGTTLGGQVLSPQTVRKLACDANIIPMVLGSQGQPLDVGRTKRLVTPALLAALWARDKGCTYPGCGRPPQWTDAHDSMSQPVQCGHEAESGTPGGAVRARFAGQQGWPKRQRAGRRE